LNEAKFAPVKNGYTAWKDRQPSLGKDEGRKTLNKLLNKQELHW